MTLVRTHRVHSGRVISLDIDTVRFPNGNVGDLEMIRHPGASAVLPFLDDLELPDPRVLLIRQYRHATGGWLWEIPAGRREPGESPEATAHRELAEETGYRAEQLQRLTSIWTTPGFTDEVIHLFLASGLTPGAMAHEADEILELHLTPWSTALQMVKDGVIMDTKTATAILFVQCHLRNAGDSSPDHPSARGPR
jgi:ADP-ribose pyrophosphatase